MVDVVMKALKKCVMDIGDRELVVQIVRKVMNAVVRNQRHITLKVAHDMVPVVRERLDEILADYPLLDDVDLEEDARLKGAACLIETEAGIADASVETQLAAIENSLKKHFSKEG
jgi:type III secretion protein L